MLKILLDFEYLGQVLKRKRYTIEDAVEVARSRGGECLSTELVYAKDKLNWRCSEGHEWVAAFHSVKMNGRWCRKCSVKNRKGSVRLLTLEILQDAARKLGGECLSDECKGAHVKHRWRCSEGHEWEALPSFVVLYGKWCQVCKTKSRVKQVRLSIEDIKFTSSLIGGTCLTQELLKPGNKMKFRCASGHIFALRQSEMLQGYWCDRCDEYDTHIVGEKRSEARMASIADMRGGGLLESGHWREEWQWICGEGHKFSMKPVNLLRGRWCGACFEKYEKRYQAED